MSDLIPKDHFKSENGIEYAGTHIIVDFWGLDKEELKDEKVLEEGMTHAAIQAGATILYSYLHPFPGGGVSGVLVLAESHISVHTWPERDYAAFDIFMCGDADPRKALEVLKEFFVPERVVVGSLKRGVS